MTLINEDCDTCADKLAPLLLMRGNALQSSREGTEGLCNGLHPSRR